ncbi:MAG: NAD-dependent epimerase/dehydratase family protein [Gaiellaceae bacterium]
MRIEGLSGPRSASAYGRNTAPPFPAEYGRRVSRVLVQGGTRFVGPFVVQRLVERGHQVTLFHRGHREPAHASGAEHVHADFAQLAAHVPELAKREPDVVLDVSPGLGKGGHGVLHFAGIARRGVVLTSMDVYRAMSVLWAVEGAEEVQPMPVSEDAQLRTERSPDLTAQFEFDNLTVERAVAEPGAAYPVTVLRCPVIYGPLDPQRRLKDYVRRMADSRPAIVLDSRLAHHRISRGYVENIAEAVVAAVSDDRAAGRTFNVGELEALSEAEWVRAVGTACGWDGQVAVADPDHLPPALQVPLPPQDLVADTSRIREELGYTETLGREEALRRAIEWEQEQQSDEPPPDYTAEDAAIESLNLR